MKIRVSVSRDDRPETDRSVQLRKVKLVAGIFLVLLFGGLFLVERSGWAVQGLYVSSESVLRAAEQRAMADRTAHYTYRDGDLGPDVQGQLRLPHRNAIDVRTLRTTGSGSPVEEVISVGAQRYLRTTAPRPGSLPPGAPWQRCEWVAHASSEPCVLARREQERAFPFELVRNLEDVSIGGAWVERLGPIRTERYELSYCARWGESDVGVGRECKAEEHHTLWLDDQDRLVRYLREESSGGEIKTYDVRYRDWGQPVRIEAPPAELVAQ